MFEQEDFDQKVGWFGGLFVSNGAFYITRSGTTSSGRDKYVVGATISVHISRKEVLGDVIEIFEIGHILQKKKTFYNREYWEVKTIREVSVVLELLDQLVWPIPVMLTKQMDIIRRFMATKMQAGRPRDPELADEVQWHRDEMYEEMKALTEWKKSIEYKEDLDAGVKRVERAVRRARRAGDPQL